MNTERERRGVGVAYGGSITCHDRVGSTAPSVGAGFRARLAAAGGGQVGGRSGRRCEADCSPCDESSLQPQMKNLRRSHAPTLQSGPSAAGKSPPRDSRTRPRAPGRQHGCDTSHLIPVTLPLTITIPVNVLDLSYLDKHITQKLGLKSGYFGVSTS